MSSSSIVPRRKRAHEQISLDTLAPSLVATGTTKTGLVKILMSLQSAGMLPTNQSGRHLRSELSKASAEHCRASTPYGTVIKSINLYLPGLNNWEYCDPCAYLYYLSSLCTAFRDTVHRYLHGGVAHIVLYIDEICPGNHFRLEKSRTLQCVYWFMSDWPEWLVSRSAAWFVLALLRSKHMEFVLGYIWGFMKKMVELMFLNPSHSLTTGVVIVCDQASKLVRGIYVGVLADEKALKEIHGFKGASGDTPQPYCILCFLVSSPILGCLIAVAYNMFHQYKQHLYRLATGVFLTSPHSYTCKTVGVCLPNCRHPLLYGLRKCG